MPFQFTVLYLLVAIVVSAVISFHAWRNTQTRGNRAFAAACITAIPWILGEMLAVSSSTLEWQWAAEILRYFGITVLPGVLYVFIRQYCGRELIGKHAGWLVPFPLFSWLMVITNPWHHLFFRTVSFEPGLRLELEYGSYFWFVHLPYSYGLLVICIHTIMSEFSRASRHHRRQILFLLVSICLPISVNVLGVLGVIGKYSAQSFPIFFSIMAYAMFRHKFLGSNPIAYETVFKSIIDGVLILDRHDVIQDINPAAAMGLGKLPSQIVGLHVRDAFTGWPAAVELYDQKPIDLGELEIQLFGSTRYLLIDSVGILASDGRNEGRIITIRDITDRHRQKLSLEAMAFHDPLTRLANRRKFQEEVERAITQAEGRQEPFAILYFDLNRFKVVNDTLGHETGDELLKYVAARVASTLRKPDLLARLGGDEFALLLHNCDENGADIVLDRLIDNVQRPFRVGNNTLIAELSVGAAYYPKDGDDLTQLLRIADSQMYRAKIASRNNPPSDAAVQLPSTHAM